MLSRHRLIRPEVNKNFLRVLQEVLTALIDEVTTPPAGILEEVLIPQLVSHKEVSSSFQPLASVLLRLKT